MYTFPASDIYVCHSILEGCVSKNLSILTLYLYSVHSPSIWLYFFAILAANFSLFVSFVWALAPGRFGHVFLLH